MSSTIDDFLKPFEQAFPEYICPWCHNYGKYFIDKAFIDHFGGMDCIFLEVNCPQCIMSKYLNRGKGYDTGTNICDKHDACHFEIKISIQRGNFDIIYPDKLLLQEKQKANYMRLMRFLRNADQSREIILIKTNEGSIVPEEMISADIVLNQYNAEVFSESKIMIQAIGYAGLIYNLPIELVANLWFFVVYEYY
jgi:hypothetical protein